MGRRCLAWVVFFNFEGRQHVELYSTCCQRLFTFNRKDSRAALGVLIGLTADAGMERTQIWQRVDCWASRPDIAGRGTSPAPGRPTAQARGWLAALGDLRMRAALSALHTDPARNLGRLQPRQNCGMSRFELRSTLQRNGRRDPAGISDRWRMNHRGGPPGAGAYDACNGSTDNRLRIGERLWRGPLTRVWPIATSVRQGHHRRAMIESGRFKAPSLTASQGQTAATPHDKTHKTTINRRCPLPNFRHPFMSVRCLDERPWNDKRWDFLTFECEMLNGCYC